MFVTHTSERTITVCVSACVPTYQSLLIACESCHLYFALVANKQVDFRENVSVHPLVLLIFPSPTSPTNLCSRSRPSRHPAAASLITSLDVGRVSLCTEVITFDARQHQTDSSHFTHEETLDSWQQSRRPKVCALVPGKHWFEAVARCLHRRRVGNKICFSTCFTNRLMTLLKLTQVGQDIPWLHRPLHLISWFGCHGDGPPHSLLIRSLFSLWARKRAPASSPLLRAAKRA